MGLENSKLVVYLNLRRRKSKNFNSDPAAVSLFTRKDHSNTFSKNLQGQYKRDSLKEKIIHKNYKKKKGSFFSNSNELGAQKARDSKNQESHLERWL